QHQRSDPRGTPTAVTRPGGSAPRTRCPPGRPSPPSSGWPPGRRQPVWRRAVSPSLGVATDRTGGAGPTPETGALIVGPHPLPVAALPAVAPEARVARARADA